MNIIRSMRDSKLFRPWFEGPSWSAWFVFLSALFGLSMTEAELEVFRLYTGRSEPPPGPAREGWVIAGRRAGKSLISALIAVFLACFRDYSKFLSPGERGIVMVLAADRKQARVVLGYIRAFLHEIPMLARLIERETAEEIHLSNGTSIEVHTSSYRRVRGPTILCVICDEIAFWPTDESANPDSEVINAIRPAMATIPTSLLVVISSPYAKRGMLYRVSRDRYGKDGDVLIWKSPSIAMNPTIPSHVIDTAYEDDPIAAAAEWGAEFRTDVENFVSREVVEGCVVPGRHELPPLAEVCYFSFVDPSGGSSDSMTLAIAHRENDVAVLDALRERRPPFSPDDVVREFSELLSSYRMSRICGDRYAGEWPRERFRTHGIVYEPAAKPKSDLYAATLPVLNAGRVELLDNKRLVAQLCSLERRTSRGGRDSIDHAPRSHDDVANVAAGVVHEILGRGRGVSWRDLYGPDQIGGTMQ